MSQRNAIKGVRRWFLMPAAVLLFGALSIAMLAWTNHLSGRQRSHYALSDALLEMQIRIATSHLWLEESFTEGSETNLRETMSNYAEAVRLSDAILKGGRSERGYTLSPPHDPEILARAEAIAKHLSGLQAIAEERLLQAETAGPGSELDEYFDRVFNELQAELDSFEDLAEIKQAADFADTRRLFLGMFVVWSLIVVAASAGLWRHESRRRQTEMKRDQLVRELENVNCELNDFAHIVSHDLKAPLRSVGRLARWLADDYAAKLDERGREQMNLLIDRVKRLHAMIDRILQYSRVGRSNEDKTEVNLNDLVMNVIHLLAPPSHIRTFIEGKLPRIVCQRTRVEQVFQNLLGNAVKFMDKPAGEIRVGCSEEGEYWKFSVSDNGPGIEERHFKRIFQMFQTLKSPDESETTGIGLALVKKIVEMYDGKVWVESAVGQGSTFYFTLKRDVN